jgi:hypothetical protein
MSRNTDEKNPASRIASMKKTMRMNDGQALVMMVAFRVVPKIPEQRLRTDPTPAIIRANN